MALASLSPKAGYSEISRMTYRVALACAFSVHRSIVWLRSLWDRNAFENNFAYFKLSKMIDLPKNQLFLYSDADDICTPESIEHFQAQQEELGVRVVAQRWTDSLHVEHLRSHPTEYAERCLDFVDSSLNNHARRDSSRA